MIKITESILIDEKNISFKFIRSAGPGGQNVNKVSTAAELRFNIMNENAIPKYMKNRLKISARNRISKEGILIITANEFRMQKKNKDEALSRLIRILKNASIKPKLRKKTKPTRSSKETRLNEKKKMSRNN